MDLNNNQLANVTAFSVTDRVPPGLISAEASDAGASVLSLTFSERVEVVSPASSFNKDFFIYTTASGPQPLKISGNPTRSDVQTNVIFLPLSSPIGADAIVGQFPRITVLAGAVSDVVGNVISKNRSVVALVNDATRPVLLVIGLDSNLGTLQMLTAL